MGAYGVEAMQKPTRSRSGSVGWIQMWSHIIYTSHRLKSAETIPRNQRERSDGGQGLGNFSRRRPVCLYIVIVFYCAVIYVSKTCCKCIFITNTVCSVAKVMLLAGLFSQCFCYKYSLFFLTSWLCFLLDLAWVSSNVALFHCVMCSCLLLSLRQFVILSLEQ